MAADNITAQRLRELLEYDPATGLFTRIVSLSPKTWIGQVAGSKAKRGDLKICVDSKSFKAHRLAWLYMTGVWPTDEIDHKDGNPLNNRFANLREATGAQNKQNQRHPRSDNSHGFLGVTRHKNSRPGRDIWCARIQVDRKTKHIGLYKTPEEAHAAYVEAKRKLHPFCTL